MKKAQKNVFKYLDLSTAHITEEDQKYLAAKTKDESNHVPLSSSIGFRVVGHDYGWWLSVPTLKDTKTTPGEFKAAVVEEGLSEAFADMILHAMTLGCFWINLDQAGEELEGLETFEW